MLIQHLQHIFLPHNCRVVTLTYQYFLRRLIATVNLFLNLCKFLGLWIQQVEKLTSKCAVAELQIQCKLSLCMKCMGWGNAKSMKILQIISSYYYYFLLVLCIQKKRKVIWNMIFVYHV